MADASCSGPNPFKRLVDHHTRDVSHHQDRLVDTSAAHGQAQSFRSTPTHGTQGQGNFRAFSNGPSALPGVGHDPAGRLAAHAAALEPAHPHHFPGAPAHIQPALANSSRASPAPDVSNWAADFQRFSGRGPVPSGQLQQTPMPSQLNQAVPQANFHAAFGQQNFAFPPIQNGAFMPGGAALAQQPLNNADFDQEMSRWMASYGGGNVNGEKMKEVDAMMDQVAHELELYEAVLPQAETAAQATASSTSFQDDAKASHFTDLETPEIGSLTLDPTPPQKQQEQPIPSVEQEEAPPAPAGKSAVSEAAERLLESVQHEDGEKWKNSVFLSLMRDFRDGRKDIVDNEIRQTDDAQGGAVKTAD
ncbi:hypothetical protein HJFPF1_09137 [Paramyrothecium foliicola]|nr:hypothetical protein HJFPF1_09137 [Paramyrothecium foliicola]